MWTPTRSPAGRVSPPRSERRGRVSSPLTPRRPSSPRTARRPSSPRTPRRPSSPGSTRRPSSPGSTRRPSRARNGGAPRSLPKPHESPRGTFIPRPVRLAALDRWKRSRNRRTFMPRVLWFVDQGRTDHSIQTAAYNCYGEYVVKKGRQNAINSDKKEDSEVEDLVDLRTEYKSALDVPVSITPSAAVYGSQQSSMCTLPVQPPETFMPRVLRFVDQGRTDHSIQNAAYNCDGKYLVKKGQRNAINSDKKEDPEVEDLVDLRTEYKSALDVPVSITPSAAVYGSQQSSICTLPVQPPEQNGFPVLPEEIINRLCHLLMTDVKAIAKMKVCCKDWLHKTLNISTSDQPMWFRIMHDRMLFYRAKDRNVFSVKHGFCLPEIQYCSSSSLGQLVTLVGEDQIIVLNLMTLSLTHLPGLPSELTDIKQAISWHGYAAGQFGTLVVSIISGQSDIAISVYFKTTGWVSRLCACNYHFDPSDLSTPVIENDKVYVIGRHCHIGIFDLDSFTWRLLPVKVSRTMYTRENCHLLLMEGTVLAIITDEQHLYEPLVLRLDVEHENWEKICSMEGVSLLSGSPTSLAVQDQLVRTSVTLPSPVQQVFFDCC
ncbi:hypothetical protein ACQ4PT_029986 [Festuca glaucescens]